MSWQNFIRKARFRGIPFHVQFSDASFGRKTANFEFPGEDIDYIEDLGKRTPIYSVDAFVIGDLYKFRKDQLLEALQRKGPGKLVHPYYGSIQVQIIGDVRVQERTEDGGFAIISFTAKQSEKPKFPQGIFDTAGQVITRALTAFEVTGQRFTDTFNLFQQPAAIVGGVVDSMNDTLNIIDTTYKEAKTVGGFTEIFDRLRGTIVSLDIIGQEIYDDLVEIFSINKTESGIYENLNFKDFKRGDGDIEENLVSYIEMIQTASVIGAAQAVSGVVFTNTTQAANIRKVIADALDDLSENVPDIIYPDVSALYGAVLADIDIRAVNLPRVVEIKNQIALPSLYMAHDLYEDIDRADEIVDRNEIVHPGFVSAGVPLEVLTRE